MSPAVRRIFPLNVRKAGFTRRKPIINKKAKPKITKFLLEENPKEINHQ